MLFLATEENQLNRSLDRSIDISRSKSTAKNIQEKKDKEMNNIVKEDKDNESKKLLNCEYSNYRINIIFLIIFEIILEKDKVNENKVQRNQSKK